MTLLETSVYQTRGILENTGLVRFSCISRRTSPPPPLLPSASSLSSAKAGIRRVEFQIPIRTTLQAFRAFLPPGVEVRRAWGGREQKPSKAVSRPFHLCP